MSSRLVPQRRDGAYLGHAENSGIDRSEGLWRLRHIARWPDQHGAVEAWRYRR
jgi:hypothetical protein